MPEAVIVAASRSPIGRAVKGSLASIRPDDLAALVIEDVLSKVPEIDVREIEDVLLGCAQPSGEAGYNIARIVSVLAGVDAPGTTVNRYCSSSLQTTRMAFHAIKAGEGNVFVSAGVESVSRYAHGKSDGLPATKNPRFDAAAAVSAAGGRAWSDPRDCGNLPDIYLAMGQTAENVAELKGVTRDEQDRFAVRSQNLAEQAAADGFWKREIMPVTLADGSVVDTDDGPRPDVTLEALSGLKTVFRENGTVTAGNCCGLNDGAAALVVMSDVRARELGIAPLARIVSTGLSSLSPEIMGLGPVKACENALRLAGMTVGDVDLVELNEAFAAQVIPSIRDLGLDPDRVNTRGGAIALGHPFGMTGARITTTLLNGLASDDKEIGMLSMCVGGGQGMAMIIQRFC